MQGQGFRASVAAMACAIAAIAGMAWAEPLAKFEILASPATSASPCPTRARRQPRDGDGTASA